MSIHCKYSLVAGSKFDVERATYSSANSSIASSHAIQLYLRPANRHVHIQFVGRLRPSSVSLHVVDYVQQMCDVLVEYPCEVMNKKNIGGGGRISIPTPLAYLSIS